MILISKSILILQILFLFCSLDIKKNYFYIIEVNLYEN